VFSRLLVIGRADISYEAYRREVQDIIFDRMAVNFALLLQSVPAEHKVSYSNNQSLLYSCTQ